MHTTMTKLVVSLACFIASPSLGVFGEELRKDFDHNQLPRPGGGTLLGVPAGM